MRRITKAQEVFVILVHSWICFAALAGPLCYNCNEGIKPHTCSSITRCGAHEKCYLERGENLMDEIVYISGCKDKAACPGTKARKSLRIDCSECCDGDFCNNAGCGQAVYLPSENEGPLCFNCTDTASPEDCFQVQRCKKGYTCSRTTTIRNGVTYYSSGCRHATECLFLDLAGNCNGCCLTDYCNKNCSMINDHKQTTPVHYEWVTVPSLPMSSPISTSTLHCVECHNTYGSSHAQCRQTSCEMFEVCYARVDFGSDGRHSFDMGCIPAPDLIGSHLDSGEMLPLGPQGISDIKEKEQTSIPLSASEK